MHQEAIDKLERIKAQMLGHLDEVGGSRGATGNTGLRLLKCLSGAEITTGRKYWVERRNPLGSKG